VIAPVTANVDETVAAPVIAVAGKPTVPVLLIVMRSARVPVMAVWMANSLVPSAVDDLLAINRAAGLSTASVSRRKN
jgi:hypothetical protein